MNQQSGTTRNLEGRASGSLAGLWGIFTKFLFGCSGKSEPRNGASSATKKAMSPMFRRLAAEARKVEAPQKSKSTDPSKALTEDGFVPVAEYRSGDALRGLFDSLKSEIQRAKAGKSAEPAEFNVNAVNLEGVFHKFAEPLNFSPVEPAENQIQAADVPPTGQKDRLVDTKDYPPEQLATTQADLPLPKIPENNGKKPVQAISQTADGTIQVAQQSEISALEDALAEFERKQREIIASLKSQTGEQK